MSKLGVCDVAGVTAAEADSNGVLVLPHTTNA